MLQPRVLTCAPNSGMPIIKTFRTHALMIHLLIYNYSVDCCNNIFFIILESYLREMYTETNIEMHPEMHSDVEMHLIIRMHPKVNIHPDVDRSSNIFPASWARWLRLVTTNFIVEKCNDMTDRVYKNIIPGSAPGLIENIGMIWSGTHPKRNINFSELLRNTLRIRAIHMK